MKTFWKMALRLVLALLIGWLGLWLRLDAANRLIIDNDEDVYMNVSLHYAWSVRQGSWKQIYKYAENAEHPVLTKLAYAGALLLVDPAERLQKKDIPLLPVQETPGALWILQARRTAAWFGGLSVFALALVSPLAGLLLAVQTLAIKFSSEVYLESLPMLTSLLLVIAYDRWQRGEFERPSAAPPRRWNVLWLLASAVCLGLTAAGKYIYCVAGLAAALDFAIRLGLAQARARHGGQIAAPLPDLRRRLALMLGWGAVSALVFLVSNPILWIHTWERLSGSIIFHINYSQSENVAMHLRQWWYPLYLLSHSVPEQARWLAPIFHVDADVLIAGLALAGVPFLWIKRRSYAVWLLVSMAFLLMWTTKWDQYVLIAIPSVCLSAAALVEWLWDRTVGFVLKPRA